MDKFRTGEGAAKRETIFPRVSNPGNEPGAKIDC